MYSPLKKTTVAPRTFLMSFTNTKLPKSSGTENLHNLFCKHQITQNWDSGDEGRFLRTKYFKILCKIQQNKILKQEGIDFKTQKNIP